jgi:hypothetical protein
MLLARRAASATLAYGWLWLVAFGVFQGLSHSQAPWHTYFTAAGLGFLAAGVFDGAAAACRGRFAAWLRLPLLKVAARAVLAACVAGVVVFQAGLLRESVVFTRYTAWHVTGELGRMYLADVQPCLAATPAGEPVVLDNFPYGLDDSTDQYVLVQAGVFANYALGPALALADGRPDLQVLEATGQGATLGGLPAALHTTCTTRDGAWWLQTTYDR